VSSKINLDKVKLSSNNYGKLTKSVSFSSITEEIKGSLSEVVAGNGKKKGAAVSTTLLSLIALGYVLYYINENNTITSEVITWSIVAFFGAIIPGMNMVKNSKNNFRKLVGGFLIQTCIPALVILRYIPGLPIYFTKWWTIYILWWAIFVLCLIISLSKISSVIFGILAILSFAIIGYVVRHYIGMGLWNIIGVIIWGLAAVVFGPFLGLGVFSDTKKTFKRIIGIIVTLLFPSLGVINTLRFPISFWSGWWIVFLIGIISSIVLFVIGLDK
jgi:hypothetical protein